MNSKGSGYQHSKTESYNQKTIFDFGSQLCFFQFFFVSFSDFFFSNKTCDTKLLEEEKSFLYQGVEGTLFCNAARKGLHQRGRIIHQ